MFSANAVVWHGVALVVAVVIVACPNVAVDTSAPKTSSVFLEVVWCKVWMAPLNLSCLVGQLGGKSSIEGYLLMP